TLHVRMHSVETYVLSIRPYAAQKIHDAEGASAGDPRRPHNTEIQVSPPVGLGHRADVGIHSVDHTIYHLKISGRENVVLRPWCVRAAQSLRLSCSLRGTYRIQNFDRNEDRVRAPLTIGRDDNAKRLESSAIGVELVSRAQ